MNKSIILNVVMCKLNEGVQDADYLKASDAITTDMNNTKGFIRRELFKSTDGMWIDLVYWESLEDAHKFAEEFSKLPSAASFGTMIDAKTIALHHFEQMRSYK